MGRIARRLAIPTPLARITASTTLTSENVGATIATDGVTVTLPPADEVAGQEIFLALESTGVVSYSLRAQSTDLIGNENFPTGTNPLTVTTNIIAYSNGSNRWYVTRET